jgi:hypothetical protein
MKQVLIILFVILIALNANSQTVKEAQEWLKYNLNKYYGDNHSHKVNSNNNAIYGGKSDSFTWDSYDFDFTDNLFIITKTTYQKKVASEAQYIYTKRNIVINLKLIIKIENESKIDTSTMFNKFQDYSEFSLIFVFVDNSTNENVQSIKEFDLLKDENKNLINGYILKYNFHMETDFKNINNDIPNRIINGLNYLVEKSGGKIIKEIF